MSERAAIPLGGNPGRVIVPGRLGSDFQTGGNPVRPAIPTERNVDMGGGPIDRGSGGGPANRVAGEWFRAHGYRWGAILGSLPASGAVLGYALWRMIAGGI